MCALGTSPIGGGKGGGAASPCVLGALLLITSLRTLGIVFCIKMQSHTVGEAIGRPLLPQERNRAAQGSNDSHCTNARIGCPHLRAINFRFWDSLEAA